MPDDEVARVPFEPGRLNRREDCKDEKRGNHDPVGHNQTSQPPQLHSYMLPRAVRPLARGPAGLAVPAQSGRRPRRVPIDVKIQKTRDNYAGGNERDARSIE